jgi:predicted PurR-regulated permease PerM
MNQAGEDAASSVEKRRRYRRVLVGGGILVVGVLMYLAWTSLLPFVVGLIIAYLLVPFIDLLESGSPRWMRRRGIARPLAILIVYLLALGLVAGVISFFVPVVSEQAAVLRTRGPVYYEQGRDIFEQVIEFYERVVPLEWQARIQENFQKTLDDIGANIQRGIGQLLSIATRTIGVVLGLVVVPFWMFYVLNDRDRLVRDLYGVIPAAYRRDAHNIQRIVDDVLSSYIRGQLLLCLFIGTLAVIGLLVLRVDFAVLLGTIAGIFEILPYIGPIIGAIPAVLVALIQSPVLAFWVIALFLVIQQAENLLLAPRITGGSVRLPPSIVMLVLVVGSGLAGIAGLLIAVPVTAICRDVFRYAYLRLSDEGMPPDEVFAKVRES